MSRLATGLARPHPLPVGLNEAEEELLARESVRFSTSKAELLRRAYFTTKWISRLIELRQEQKTLNHPLLKKYR